MEPETEQPEGDPAAASKRPPRKGKSEPGKGGRGGRRAGAGRKPNDQHGKPESLERARARLTSRNADLREDQLRKFRSELHVAADCTRAKEDENRMLKSALLAVPSRVRAKLPHLTAEDIRVLDEEIRAALKALGEGDSPSTSAP